MVETNRSKIVSIANQKGGVGKTTTVINLAHWFSLKGYKVLAIDLDGQGHVAPGFRMEKSSGLYSFLVQEMRLSECVKNARDKLDILPNDHTNELVKEHIKQANFREYLLDTSLDEARELYDLIFLDTPPSTDVLHILALVASDLLVIPANMDFYALDGVGHILKTLKALGRYPNVVPPKLIGVLPTLYDKTTNETLRNVQALQNALGSESILPPIPRDTKLREAVSFGQTIWEYAPRSQGAIGYTGNGTARYRNSEGNVGGYLHLAEILESLIV